MGSGGFYGKYSITEKYILVGPVSILWIHTEEDHQQHKLAARVKKLDASWQDMGVTNTQARRVILYTLIVNTAYINR